MTTVRVRVRRRRGVAVVLSLLVALVGPATLAGTAAGRPLGGSQERTEAWAYIAANTRQTHYDTNAVNVCDDTVGLGCVAAETRGRERWLSVSVADHETAQPVSALIRGAGKDVLICGQTDKPVYLGRNSDAYVFVFVTGGPDCPGPGTTGTVTLTYSSTK